MPASGRRNRSGLRCRLLHLASSRTRLQAFKYVRQKSDCDNRRSSYKIETFVFWIMLSAVPSLYTFQLSAVPTGNLRPRSSMAPV